MVGAIEITWEIQAEKGGEVKTFLCDKAKIDRAGDLLLESYNLVSHGPCMKNNIGRENDYSSKK